MIKAPVMVRSARMKQSSPKLRQEYGVTCKQSFVSSDSSRLNLLILQIMSPTCSVKSADLAWEPIAVSQPSHSDIHQRGHLILGEAIVVFRKVGDSHVLPKISLTLHLPRYL